MVAGRYQLGERLGCGSMGEVWAGHDLRDQRPVAVKLLLPELVGASSEPHVRFMREAMVLTKIRSPHVVEVYDYGEDKATPFIVMERLTGIDLQRLLSEQGRLHPAALCVLTSDVAQALHAIHGVGVVHRDLKPSNIILCQVDGDRVAKVIDFGIARPAVAAMKITGLRMLGTAHYMSPEQCLRAAQADHRSDLWALGVIAYRALTGAMPFDGGDVVELVGVINRAPALPPTRLVAGLPAAIDAFFERALAKRPEDRFQSALELAQALEEALAPLRTGRPIPEG